MELQIVENCSEISRCNYSSLSEGIGIGIGFGLEVRGRVRVTAFWPRREEHPRTAQR